jgi:hypothetical protein
MPGLVALAAVTRRAADSREGGGGREGETSRETATGYEVAPVQSIFGWGIVTADVQPPDGTSPGQGLAMEQSVDRVDDIGAASGKLPARDAQHASSQDAATTVLTERIP